MGTLLLIRHGQASYGEVDYDRLSARGEQQARALGQFLSRVRLDHIYAGPHVRHQQTLEHALQSYREGANAARNDADGRALPAHTPATTLLPSLAEYPAFELMHHFMPRLVAEDRRFADLPKTRSREIVGKALHTILGKWARDEWHHESIERVEGFAQRVQGALETIIASASSGARIAVITSAGPIGVAAGLTFGASPHHMVRTSVVVRNASISELRFRSHEFAWHPERIALVTFNSTHHLPPELQTEY